MSVAIAGEEKVKEPDDRDEAAQAQNDADVAEHPQRMVHRINAHHRRERVQDEVRDVFEQPGRTGRGVGLDRHRGQSDLMSAGLDQRLDRVAERRHDVEQGRRLARNARKPLTGSDTSVRDNRRTTEVPTACKRFLIQE